MVLVDPLALGEVGFFRPRRVKRFQSSLRGAVAGVFGMWKEIEWSF